VSKIKYVSDRWKDSLNIARDVVHNDLRLEELDGALYFHNTHVRPNWGLERVARIGGHIFYSDDPAPKKRLTVSQK
jgi:spore germination cell wall hydrolase CwlJ-like protein